MSVHGARICQYRFMGAGCRFLTYAAVPFLCPIASSDNDFTSDSDVAHIRSQASPATGRRQRNRTRQEFPRCCRVCYVESSHLVVLSSSSRFADDFLSSLFIRFRTIASFNDMRSIPLYSLFPQILRIGDRLHWCRARHHPI